MKYKFRKALQVIIDECALHKSCENCGLYDTEYGCCYLDNQSSYPGKWEIPPEEPDDPLAYTE